MTSIRTDSVWLDIAVYKYQPKWETGYYKCQKSWNFEIWLRIDGLFHSASLVLEEDDSNIFIRQESMTPSWVAMN